jgi:hypothetical protein
MKKTTIKRPVATVLAVAIALTVPTLAVAKHRHLSRPHNVEFGPYGAAPVPCSPFPACTSPNAVISAGTYVGADPDPRMRAMLLTDFNRGVNATRGGR